jgi:predicted ATPase/class 3 adenylate cyclase
VVVAHLVGGHLPRSAHEFVVSAVCDDGVVTHGGIPPAGVLTFLFTDVEGSTRLWAADAAGMSASLRTHDEVLRRVIDGFGGYVFTTAGDAFCVAFARATDAVECARAVQAELGAVEWPGPALRVRMGLHLGEAELRDGDYFGPTVNTAARVESAGHGGQILVTEAVRSAATVETVDLGVHRLRDVVDPVHLHQVGHGDFPTLRVIPETLSSLPIPATPLFGREAEIRLVRSLLLDHRLVTITGVGGSGKTRLAIEVAERELAHFPHGVYFADLSSVSDDDGVVAAVAGAVRLQLGGRDGLGRLLEHLTDKQALVVLDNCEHVIDACAEFAGTALEHRGQWRLLATSREHLDVDGERVVQAPSLATAEHGPAVELFADRAASVQPSFRVDDANRPAVTELCERLDGMPLAIELAAARIVVMSPAELLERIDDRFRLLSGGRRRTRQRQRTLEATLDWSYELLEAPEQRLLNVLGVAVGPFDVALAASVADVESDEAVDVLASLVAKSLVGTRHDGDRTLFDLLETVRAYAQDHLRRSGDLEAARDRHLEHHLASMTETKQKATISYGAATVWDWATVQRWTSTKANLEAAIDWAIARGRHHDAGELIAAAGCVWREQLAVQATLDRIDAVVAQLPESSNLRERLWSVELMLALTAGARERLLGAMDGLAHSDDETTREIALAHAANRCAMNDPNQSLQIADQASSLHSRSPDLEASGFWDKNRADILIFAGDYEQALDTLRPHQGRHLWAVIDGTIAVALLMNGQPAEALRVANDHPMSDSIWMSFGVIVGLCHLALGDTEVARRDLVAEARWAALGRMNRAPNSALIGLAALVNHQGDTAWAREIILGARSQREVVFNALARAIAEEIGVRDEFIEQQDPVYANYRDDDRRDFLVETLARLDTPQPAERHTHARPT